jgi:hypothetical protein
MRCQKAYARRSLNPAEDRLALQGKGDQHEENWQERKKTANRSSDLLWGRLLLPKGVVLVWEKQTCDPWRRQRRKVCHGVIWMKRDWKNHALNEGNGGHEKDGRRTARMD